MSEKSKNVLIIVLIVIIAVLIFSLSYILGMKFADKNSSEEIINKDNENKVVVPENNILPEENINIEKDDNNSSIEEGNVIQYNIENIESIILKNPCTECVDPDGETKTVNTKSDIKCIIDVLNGLNYEGVVPEGIGFEFSFDIKINNIDGTVDEFWIMSDRIVKPGYDNTYKFYSSSLDIIKLLRQKYFN